MNESAVAKREGENVEAVNERAAVTPRVDIFESKDEYLVQADVPGAAEDRIKLHLDKERLTIEAQVLVPRNEPVARQEFELRDYRRSFVIPDVVDRDKVSAELKHGVLTLRLPKSDAVKPRRIEVRAG